MSRLKSNDMTQEERQSWLASLQIGDTVVVEHHNIGRGIQSLNTKSRILPRRVAFDKVDLTKLSQEQLDTLYAIMEPALKEMD